MVRDVNFVWAYVNEWSFKAWQRERRFMSGCDIDQYTAGATRHGLNLHSTTVQSISKELVTRRRRHNKVKLRWRVSHGSRRSLDQPLSLWDSYGRPRYELGAGKRARVKAIHAKIANRRKDHLRKFNIRLVAEHGAIFVGHVNAAALARTRMAQSVLDAGWSMLRTMLQY